MSLLLNLRWWYNPLKRMLKGVGMKFNSKVWGGYELRVSPSEFDLLRVLSLLPSPISMFTVPYFWDTDINLELLVKPTKDNKRASHRPWRYKWRLCDLDGNILNNKQGDGEYDLKAPMVKRDKGGRSTLRLGYLKPYQHYDLRISFTDNEGQTSPQLSMATFTVKDRDEFQMLLFMGIVIIIVGIILGRWG